MFLSSLLPVNCPAADFEREQRIASQIIDSIMDGDPIELSADGHDFLAIHMQSDAAQVKGAALILHGRGLHPDWESVVQPLRTALPEHGWHTLSIQLPVLHKQATYFDYVPYFPEASHRIEAALHYLKEQGITTVVLIAHSCGAHMAMHRIRNAGDTGLAAYVGIGMGATDLGQKMQHPFPLEGMSIPVLDIFAEKDFPAVLRMAPERLSKITAAGHPQSTQRVIAGAEHYYNDDSEPLVQAIIEWLNALKL
ncbi:MAG: alpha/beta hydrolase family protein [Chromatiales bacterium]|nr:alpha/beta hydrolase family protein [Chromatiales bacterium]